MKKAGRWILTGSIAFVALLAALLAAALYSETVFRSALNIAEPLIPGELSFDSLEGTLAGPVNATGVDYHVAGTRITAKRLSFNLSPSALLSNRVRIRALEAQGLTVTLPEAQEKTESEPTRPADMLQRLSLPVHLDVTEARLRNVSVLRADGNPLVKLGQLDFSLDWTERKLTVADLAAESPSGTIAGDVVLGLKEGVRTDVALEGQWKIATTTFAGAVNASGKPAALSLDVSLRQPAKAELEATLRDLLDSANWEGTLQVQELALDAIRPSLPQETWSANLSFQGDWNDTQLNGNVQGGWPPATGIDLAIQGKANMERLVLDRIEGRVAAFDSRVDASGRLRYGETFGYAVKGRFSRFAWPSLEKYSLRDGQFDIEGDTERLRGSVRGAAGERKDAQLRLSGELAFEELRFAANARGRNLAFAFNDTPVAFETIQASGSGVPRNYRFEATTLADVAQLPPARIELNVEGDTTHLAADIATIEWLGGTAQGGVRVAWEDMLKLQGELQARNFSLEQLDPSLAGTIGGRFSASADFAGTQPRVTLQVHSLDGSYNGLAINGSGSLRLADGRLATQGLTLQAGDAQLVLDDASSGGFDFRLDAPALERFHPRLAGSLEATGTLQGSLETPTVSLDASGTNLGWQDWRAASLEVDAMIRNGGRKPSEAQLSATGLETPAISAGVATASVTGTLSEHRMEAQLQEAGSDGAGRFAFAAEGGLQENQWTGDIETLRFDHPQTGEWALAEAARDRTIALGADQVRIPELCLQGPEGEACLGPASGAPGALEARGRLDALPVSVIAGWLPPGLDYEGRISGRFSMRRTDTGPQGILQLSLTPGGIRQVAGEGYETLMGWTSGEANIELKGNVANGDLEIELADGGRITGRGRIDMPPQQPATIDAQLNASIDNLQLLPSLVPELSRIQGRLLADLRVHGDLDAPRVQGRARLRDGSARILALGGDWKNINLTLDAEGRQLSGSGHIESGDGFVDIELSGRDTDEGFSAQARIEGENFKAAQTPEANVDISPDLEVRLQGRDLYVSGEVFVPKAQLEPRDLTAATDVSEDQVIVNEEAGENGKGLRVNAEVTTRLGDEVHLEGFGLIAEIEGQVTVTKVPGNPPTGNGKLFVTEGQYKAYGQELTLAKGEIIYTGQPIRNPGLDIRAERRPHPDTMAGISVRGPLSNPTTSIYSDPPMSDTAALGLLLFGRTVEEATNPQAEQLNEASIALGVGGGRLLEDVGKRLGVEEVSVQDIGSTQRASLVLGKYLSPDLYVSYGIGLFEAVNTFRVRYRISRRWTLEATSGLKSSADFLYTIER